MTPIIAKVIMADFVIFIIPVILLCVVGIGDNSTGMRKDFDDLYEEETRYDKDENWDCRQLTDQKENSAKPITTNMLNM